MNSYLESSAEFASLATRLQKQPDDSALKFALIKRLPEIKTLAKSDPWAMYCLAHMYSPNSMQYEKMMRQSAEYGCTNAMLAVCELLLRLGTKASFKEAQQFLTKIAYSQDSYILERAEQLMVSAEKSGLLSDGSKKYPSRFFAEEVLIMDSSEGINYASNVT